MVFILFFFLYPLPRSLTKFTSLPKYLVIGLQISFLIGQVILLFGHHNDPIDIALWLFFDVCTSLSLVTDASPHAPSARPANTGEQGEPNSMCCVWLCVCSRYVPSVVCTVRMPRRGEVAGSCTENNTCLCAAGGRCGPLCPLPCSPLPRIRWAFSGKGTKDSEAALNY